MSRTYEELMTIDGFEARYEYLKLEGKPGYPTFGHERWMNQQFYHSVQWKQVRSFVITRDQGFDLGSPDRPIAGKIMIHHMIPLNADALTDFEDYVLDPNYLISCSMNTHNAIHYGDISQVADPVERGPNDTSPWRH